MQYTKIINKLFTTVNPYENYKSIIDLFAASSKQEAEKIKSGLMQIDINNLSESLLYRIIAASLIANKFFIMNLDLTKFLSKIPKNLKSKVRLIDIVESALKEIPERNAYGYRDKIKTSPLVKLIKKDINTLISPNFGNIQQPAQQQNIPIQVAQIPKLEQIQTTPKPEAPVRKAFDENLYKENDDKAKTIATKIFNKLYLFEVQINPDKYGADLILFKDKKFVSFGEAEIKKVWTGDNFPYDSIQFPERKAKFVNQYPVIFCMINNKGNKALMVNGNDLISSPLVVVPNKYVPQGEKFFQVPLNKAYFVDIDKLEPPPMVTNFVNKNDSNDVFFNIWDQTAFFNQIGVS